MRRQFAITIDNQRAHRQRRLHQFVAQAAAEREATTVQHFLAQRTELAEIYSLAGQMRDDARFGVQPGRQLGQGIAAAGPDGMHRHDAA